MNAPRTTDPVVRRVLRGVLLWIAGEALLLGLARLAASRLDQGSEMSTTIRRLYMMGGEELRPTNPELARIRVDAIMGGGLLDLTAIPSVPGGVDVTVRALMGGIGVRVPVGWRTWWSFRGVMGGVGSTGGIERVTDPAAADLRLHVHALMGGVGIEPPKV
jgi:hypothetical protein